MESHQKSLRAALSQALFGQKTEYEVQDESYKEAMQQAVLPLLMSVAPNSSYQKENGAILANSIRSFYEHGELHEIMTDAHVPYVVLKGAVSASYYPDPVLRSMGDVDFFVRSDDIAKSGAALENNEFTHENLGYLVYDDAYRRDDSVWELHWGISGTPETKIGEVIQGYLSNLIEKAVLTEGENGGFFAPSDFHHCLILLLHSIHHMVGGGIGLRHLCDWAVFAHKVDVSQWETELKECGLFQLARVLTLVSIRYLGMPYQNWCGEEPDAILEQFMDDILDAGNFGNKDQSRHEDGLFIGTEGDGEVSDAPFFVQLIKSLAYITENHWSSAKKNGIIRVVGMMFFGVRYALRVIMGKRRMIKFENMGRAKQRRELYSVLRVFEEN